MLKSEQEDDEKPSFFGKSLEIINIFTSYVGFDFNDMDMPDNPVAHVADLPFYW
jgi:hypothetical protein